MLNEDKVSLAIALLLEDEEMRDFISSYDPVADWRKFARKVAEKLIHDSENEIMWGILEDRWQETKYLHYEREEYYHFGETPLDVLEQCVLDDYITYPPPEVLVTIAFNHRVYKYFEGKISAEECFFGSPKGRGVFAARITKDDELFKRFYNYANNPKNKNFKQFELLETLLTVPEYWPMPAFDFDAPADAAPSDKLKSEMVNMNPFYGLNDDGNFNEDTFLRNYRRWKTLKEQAD